MRAPCYVTCLIALGLSLLGGPVHARLVSLTLLHTTDVHGHILPSTDYDGRENVGGLLRCATLIEQEREARENVLLVDCGDFFQGSPESYVSQGEVLFKAFEWLNYDAVVVGNHEFDWGGGFLKQLIKEDRLPLIGGNIILDEPDSTLASWRLKEVDGLRVALVGLSTPGMPKWFRPEVLEGFRIERSVVALGRIMPEVRAADPDITILVAHMGYPAYGRQRTVNEIEQVVRLVPEFDVIVGGHTHKTLSHELVNGSLYSQAGYHGIWLGKVELEFDTVQNKLTKKSGRLLGVTAEIPEHAGLRKELEETLRAAQKTLAEPLGHAGEAFTLEEAMPGCSAVQQLICRAIHYAHPCDFVLHGKLDDKETLPAGPINIRDLFRIVPYDNEIGIAQLTSSNLRDILEENTRHWNRHHFLGVWGLSYEVDMKQPLGSRISALRVWNGDALHGQKRYAVAMNSFVLASAGGRFPVLRSIVDDPRSRLTMLGTQTREALQSYIESYEVLVPEHRAEVTTP